MNDKLEFLLGKIRELEQELMKEIRAGEEKFGYEVQERKVTFRPPVQREHRRHRQPLHRYFGESRFLVILSTPVIWSCAVPVIFMDLMAEIYQFICFPIYGIPKVRRKDYVVLDRQHLRYLNSMEHFNCVYCGYVNGVIAYVQEIAGRTEQYWCPIKHAISLKTRHSRYHHFLDYGDAEQYRQRLEVVRRDFKDLKNKAQQTP